MTKLAAAIFVHTVSQALAAAHQARSLGADLVEYRIDGFDGTPRQVAQLLSDSPLPCILTCRPTWEGGLYDQDDQQRISLLEQSVFQEDLNASPTYLDMELEAYQRSFNLRQKIGLMVQHPAQVRQIETGLILSSHDFQQRPADLYQRIEAMAASTACRVIKVAWMARSLRDNLEAFSILRSQYKPTIALCMGEMGLASRVLAKKFGALLTFASLDDDQQTAPGQPTLTQIKQTYRWDAINAQTKVYGVIGYPVGHSMSPAIHNRGFDVIGFNGVYLPMPIAPGYEPFKATLDAWLNMPELHFRGASVTIPHKQNLIRFVQEQGGQVEDLALRVGAANTLTVGEDGSLFASNTDYAGALDAVADSLDITREQLQGQQVGVIGAGGVSRAIVAGFAHYGALVTIYNRTPQRAHELVKALSLSDSRSGRTVNGTSGETSGGGEIQVAPLESLGRSACQILINCTPLGMHPHVEGTPIAEPHRFEGWGPGTVVFDTVYNPRITRLLQDARAAGCVTVPGTSMFTRQAAAQFKLWTGQDAPLEEFEKILEERLG